VASSSGLIIASEDAQLEQLAISVLDQVPSLGLPNKFQEKLQDVYKEIMPVLKRIFYATIEAHENSLSVEVSLEMA
jgi:hypothetical protein